MAQPKKRTSKTKTGMRRSHLIEKLRRAVNKTSPVKAAPVKKNRRPAAAAKPAPAAKPAAAKKTAEPAAKPKAENGRKAAKP